MKPRISHPYLVACCKLIALGAILGLAIIAALAGPPAAAMSRSHPTHTAARKTSANMQPMPCMSEMQAMMASMHHTHHAMSKQAMMAMMVSMHLPRHATHAQCMHAMQTMMAKMHPQRQAWPMYTMPPAGAITRRTRVQPVSLVQAPPCEYVS